MPIGFIGTHIDYDVLIHTSDTLCYHFSKAPKDVAKSVLELDRASNVKQGYVQRIEPLGFKWGELEKDPKRFLHLIIPGNQINLDWLQKLKDVSNEDVQDAIWRFPLENILTESELLALKNIPFNDTSVRPTVEKYHADYSTLIEQIKWDKMPEPFTLHGSAGNFDVEEDGGGDAYTSLKTAIETEAADILAGSTDANFYINLAWDNADTADWDIDGWTMGTNHMLIQTTGNARSATGLYNDGGTRYRIENGTSEVFDIETSNVTVDGICFTGVVTTSAGAAGLAIANCHGVCGTGMGILLMNTGGGTDSIYNCIFRGSGSGLGDEGVFAHASYVGTLNIYNCTIWGFIDGIEQDSGPINVYNCAVFDCGDDFDSVSGTIDYCASDDGDGTNVVAPSGADWDNEFNNIAGADFTLLSGGNLAGGGTDDPGSGLYSDDIIGTARSSTWDIGAFEVAAAGGQALPPLAMHQYRQRRI